MKNKKILGIVGIILVILIIGAVVFGQNNFKKAEKKTEKTTCLLYTSLPGSCSGNYEEGDCLLWT